MQILTLSGAQGIKAKDAHEAFASYLRRTKNTICGRHPIGVLFAALGCLESAGKEIKVDWVRYEQSSAVKDVSDSSVSYASAFVLF